MRIKRIEIIGFKSFCDRSVLNFSEPVTGIVGPNGCGKSNIVDAIRWCMGEQSAKHLRGQAMGDVIFAGSDSRDPAGMAEVSLTFEEVGYSAENLKLALEREDQALGEAVRGEAPAEAEAPAPADGEGEGEAVAEGEAPAEGEPLAAAEGEAPAEGETPAEGEGEAPAEGEGEAPAEDRQSPDVVGAVLADRPPAIDYSQYSEVTVTRRLFRDGTSQYLLNKTPCRLRDITDFFLGTGVGTKAYSIIEQGRIGMIVSSRASERRHIIEEAAGITKFKFKKRAAERKLDQTRQNLLRVSDIVEELGKRLGTLRRQAQKAERYRRYRAEVKDIELHMAAHKYLGIIAEQKQLTARQRQLAEELQAVRAELDALEGQVVAERAELSVEERRLSELQEQIYELDNTIKLTESKVQFQRREAAALEERATGAQGEIRGLEERQSETAGELERQRAGLGELESQLDEIGAAIDDRDASFLAARDELARSEAQLESSRAELAAARAELARAESQREALRSRRDDAERRLERVLEDTEQHNRRSALLSREVKGLEQTLARLRQQRLDLTVKTEELERRRGELEEGTAAGEAALEALRDELHRRKSRLASLREIHDKYEGFARGTRAIMQRQGELGERELGEAIRGLVADIVEVPERLEVAAEAALGEALGGILVTSPQVSAEAIGFLKESGGGRSTFVPTPPPQPAWAPAWSSSSPSSAIEFEDRSAAPAAFAGGMTAEAPAITGEGVFGPMAQLIDATPGYESLVRDLVGDAVVVESLDCALSLRESGARCTLVTLEGDLVDDRGVVTGGSRDALGSGVLAQKREIRELEEICASLEGDLAAATARFVQHKAELTRVTKTLESLRSDSHDGELAITGHEKELAGARAELERLRGQRARLNAEQLELEETVRSSQAREAELEAVEVDASGRIERLTGDCERLAAGMGELRQRVESMGEAVTEAKIKVAKLGEKRASAEASAYRLESARRELAERIGRLEASISSDTERAATLRREADELEGQLTELSQQRSERAAELGDGRQAYDARTAAVQEGEIEARKRRSAVESLTAEVNAVEVKLTNVEMSARHLETGIDERYQVELPRVLGDYHLRPPVTDEDEKRLAQRRKLIERMGTDINLTAIEEFAEISERHEFLSQQKIDLESAVDQLEKAIAKIDRVSRKLFKETFDAVNERFSDVFPRLFRGGRAKLALTPAKGAAPGAVDLLEAGVEIMAQPPGKKNTTVDQLSGGEKALTAVALLFAIFLIKPSPFCLLDEVDAPLDDANVDRYNAMLREMTNWSQFICITHNKRTMEIADRLYGVTMQEPGVSKLVTVNLAKIGEGDGDGQAAA